MSEDRFERARRAIDLGVLLLDAGAPAAAETRGAGGTPLAVALFWGRRVTGETLAARGGTAPGNLRVAAGLGDLALSWAARNDRSDALDLLVARGARLDADVYRGTALGWAACRGRLRAIDRRGGRGRAARRPLRTTKAPRGGAFRSC
ncbi:hypothetical protein VSS74_29715 [Conexibacter stalactiti]|uniref:Ankyrin repeat domain-containing protein n=1 Tax=Conexibacter stalactiti TaxID=1940611 RepID=A0ABU4HZC0_9ACTN|nr:hypothetical protein [Conexibacter stalactiti]MDW5598575.1 hypothetical protein [Conexibacter stalactiti]MEC5039217.1 hypothetical protein [Conexibacter stalactiti]